MKTLVYSPRVEAFVRLRSGKIIDLSKDIAGGNIRRTVNEPSTAQLTLNNRNGRYSGTLAIMDAIHIRFYKGSVEYPYFTGYLTTVPVYDLYNTTVTIEAQCTLKQIVHTYWDRNSAEAIARFVGDIRPLETKNVVVNSGLFNSIAGETVVAATGTGSDIVNFAKSKIGAFSYSQAAGRTSPETSGYTDCSGFVKYCYQKIANIDVGNSSHEQVFKGSEAGTYSAGQPITESTLQLADLIIYGDSPNSTRHVDMYIGGGKILSHGGPGRGPTEHALNYRSGEWRQIRRHLSPSSQGTSTGTPSTSTGWVKPGGTSVTSPYGYRTHPVHGDRRLHDGIDYAASCGSPIYAAKAGTVETVSYNSSAGNYVVINHGNGIKTRYLHIQNNGTMVKVGQKVNAGQQIAKVGTTGTSTGCHIHFTIIQNGSTVNPAPFLAGAATSSGSVSGPESGSADASDFWKPNPDFDNRAEYYSEQARAGIDGVRLKGFLNEVCNWPMDNILIELFPERLAQLVQGLNIVEGTSDPEEELQSIYRLLMGDTFSQTAEQSEATLDGKFTGSEGGGDKVFTKTMYGIGQVVSGLDYKHKSDLFPGSGAYGFAANSMNKSKEAQDAEMLSELKSMVSSGTSKAVGTLAEKYAMKRIPTNRDRVQTFVHNVNLWSTKAPSYSGPKTTTVTTPSVPSTESGIELFLKGMRETESSGNYQEGGGYDKWVGQISGAYQMGTTEWKNYGGYPEARLAPPAVQDAHARELFSGYYKKYGSWELAAAYHLYPVYAQDKSKWDTPIPGNMTLNTYVKKVLRYMTGNETLDGSAAGSGGNQAAMMGELLDQSFYAFFRSAVATNQTISEESMRLSGEKALMNDESAISFVKLLTKGALREFQSDPFGNFTAFYPDYFGWYNPDAKIVKLQDLELRDFKIRATDQIYSHVYVIDGANYVDLYNTTAPVADVIMKESAEGVVTLENEKLISSLLGMKPAQAKQFLNLYGARPYVENHYEILNKAFAKLYSLQLFLARWAGQYNTSCDVTFMPELWPGVRAAIGETGVGVYVQSVTHSFSYSSGFTTTFVATCPQELSSGTVIDSATGLWLPDGGAQTTLSGNYGKTPAVPPASSGTGSGGPATGGSMKPSIG